MRAIMVMYDSLNRNYLQPYTPEAEDTPNFARLARHAVCFTGNYANSLPCMPARRELHTGRYNFLHRSWGPLEPFDDSMPELLKQSGIYSHLISDHRHYWEDGGSTYHNRYSSWEVSRGQEGDPWKGVVEPAPERSAPYGNAENPYILPRALSRCDSANRRYIREKADMPQVRTFDKGIAFIDTNRNADHWFLQIETFDPHEPFYVPGEAGEELDWPPYYPVREEQPLVEQVRERYRALMRICDEQLGRVLDRMDEYDMWKDTLLIVNTDHGFLLGEHGWWGKSVMPLYEELVHTPLFLYDPRFPTCRGMRHALTQNIDLAPTLLEFFDLPIPERMCGKPLRYVLERDVSQHDYALFGIHGGYLNITDGDYVYMLPPAAEDNQPCYEYTLLPTHMASMFSKEELRTAELVDGAAWNDYVPMLRIRKPYRNAPGCIQRFGTRLYDLKADPDQNAPLQDAAQELRMLQLLQKALKEHDCPEEQYLRMGLPREPLTEENYASYAARRRDPLQPDVLPGVRWETAAAAMWQVLAVLFPHRRTQLAQHLTESAKQGTIKKQDMDLAIRDTFRAEELAEAIYYAELNGKTF